MSDYIPDDIQAEILKLLPVKTLLRFRRVCRWWKQLIDSASFVQDHLALQNPQFLLQVRYLEEERYPEEFLVLDLPSPSSHTPVGPTTQHLLGTLHGIVSLYDHHHDDGLVSLWNPSIRKLSTLPTSTFLHSKWKGNDLIGTTYSAFWIDPSTKDFKIVLFKLMLDNVVNDGTIFSSSQGHWTELALGEVANLVPLRESPAIVMKGVAYWRACYFIDGEDEEGLVCMYVVLISFDFGLERFDIVEAPSVNYREWYHPVLCNWRGVLSLVYVDTSHLCDVYVRREGLWVNMFCFKLPYDIWPVHWVLGEMEENNGVLVEERRNKMLASSDHELVLCDTRGDRIPVKSGLEESFDCFMANGFVESLLFPEGL